MWESIWGGGGVSIRDSKIHGLGSGLLHVGRQAFGEVMSHVAQPVFQPKKPAVQASSISKQGNIGALTIRKGFLKGVDKNL